MKKLLWIITLCLLWFNISHSNEISYNASNFIMQKLINALVETKKPKSLEVAKDLMLIAPNAKSYDLVIRKAKLDIIAAKNIGKAINLIDQNSGPKLGTLSMSFNENLKDEGVISILNQIPKTTSVIAFVECGITDKAASAIIKWANEADNIDGIYLEGNSFSKEMELKFDKLRADKPNTTVLSEWASEEFKEMVKKSFN
jgi:hypothetical protein